ncbi:MAG: YrhK family protein [Azospirillaceae bacterium]
MPHLFVNRPRLHDLADPESAAGAQFRWETANAVLYKIGGLTFIVGSVLFFPAVATRTDLGAWVFLGGSLLYLVVTGHDLVEAVRYRRRHAGRPTVRGRLEPVAAISYVAGTLLFTVGSAFFLSSIGLTAAGAWCFTIGSLLFILGATVNVLEIVTAEDLITLQLMNLTALCFVTGSLLFTVASIPYLWQPDDPLDRRVLDDFLAAQFLAGSVLFWLGGVFSYRRARRVFRAHRGGDPAAPR